MSLKTLLDAAEYLEQQEQALVSPPKKAPSPSPPPLALQTITVSTAATNMSNGFTPITISKGATPLPTTVLFTTSADLAPSLLTLAHPTTVKPTPAPPQRRILHNSFDIIDPLANKAPMAFRAGTREVHNNLEKHRRAQLKECFDALKKQLPVTQDEKKTSNLNILHSALRYIQSLKRKERELEHEMERLARDKITAQNRLAVLKKDISLHCDNFDFGKILPETQQIVATTSCDQQNGAENAEIDEIKLLESVAAAAASAQNQNGHERIILPGKNGQIAIASKDINGQPVQTMVSMGYPQGLVLKQLAIVPTKNGLTELAPLVSTHFITQQNGKVVPLVNAQYVVKPVVVVSRPS